MKCRDCPLTLRCYAGKLVPLNWCPECFYLVCLRDPHLRVSFNVVDTVAQSIRLRCELRTEEMRRRGGTRGAATDPVVAKNTMGVIRCSKCEAEWRLRKGQPLLIHPDEYTKVELD